MSFPFETTVGRLVNTQGRHEVAYLPAGCWLAADLDAVNDQRNTVKWLPVEDVERGALVTVVADGLRFGPFAARRQIVLRAVTS